MKVECETKSKLLRTAMEMIWESSYGSVSVDDICRRAGVKKGSFYYFFPSKAELTIAAIEEHWQEKRPHLDADFASQASVPDRISACATRIYEAQRLKKEQFGKVCGCPYISIGSELGTQDERIRIKTEDMVNRTIRYWESLVRDAQADGLTESKKDAGIIAREIYSYVLGVIIQARLKNDLAPLLSIQSGVERLLGLKEALVS